MKYTRKGTNEAASKACEKEPKPRVRRSARLVLGWGRDVPGLILRVQRSQILRLFPNLRNFLLDLLRVLGQIVAEDNCLIRRVVDQPGQQREQQNHGHGSGQAARKVETDQQFHHRRQNECQQH